MNRLDDQLQRDLRVIADRATPSPDAWQQILTKAADQEPTQETEIIMLTDNTLPTRRWPLVAAAAAIAVVAVGAIIAFGTGGDDTEQPADIPPPTVAPDPPVDEVDEATEPLPAVVDGPRAFPAVGSVLEPGSYTSDTPGVTVTLTLGEGQTAPWTLAADQDAGIQLLSDESGREFVGVGRIGSWFDADEARDENTTGLGSIAADDIDGWIEQNGIIVVDSAEVEVGGRPAEYRQFRLDTTPGATADFCPESEQPCLWAVSGSADVIDENWPPVPVGRDRLHSIWLVDMAPFEPLFVIAIPSLDDEATWFAETVQPIIDSIELGEPAPAVEGGTALLPLRVDVFASYSGTRSVGPLLDDGTAEVISTNTVEGDLVGELTGVGVQVTPASGYDDLTFTGTIDGLGTGTLTMRQEWTGSASGDIATTTTVTGGTGDLAGITGRVITSVDAPDESGEEPIYRGRQTYQLVVPQSG